ncbi:SMI1/KNR4 family protein [Yersinia sp. J1]|uniref:SMI1/KNR4 family protein n=1 Tax=unclassified Yersinia (in: enterobacteria) TaxID=2653513 RepID=UPI000EB26F1B|nr:SMI1/KNR4 family protein [Yersinia sp. IP36721]
MLLTIEEIESQLDKKFSPFDGEMDDLILTKRKFPISNLESSEKTLDITFPSDFVSFLKKYDIDNFSLGNVAFGSGGDYLEKIIALNDKDNFSHWWVGNTRPRGVIVIALSDPYAILLNTNDCKIYAITSEERASDREPIAIDFNKFIRGVGSVFLKACSRNEIEILVGSKNSEFWTVI